MSDFTLLFSLLIGAFVAHQIYLFWKMYKVVAGNYRLNKEVVQNYRFKSRMSALVFIIVVGIAFAVWGTYFQ